MVVYQGDLEIVVMLSNNYLVFSEMTYDLISFLISTYGKLCRGKKSVLGLWWMTDYYKGECTLGTYPIHFWVIEYCTNVAACGSWNCSVQRNMLIKAVSFRHTKALNHNSIQGQWKAISFFYTIIPKKKEYQTHKSTFP